MALESPEAFVRDIPYYLRPATPPANPQQAERFARFVEGEINKFRRDPELPGTTIDPARIKGTVLDDEGKPHVLVKSEIKVIQGRGHEALVPFPVPEERLEEILKAS